MSLPKKTLLACVSAAALVASVGFVQAQSPDQDATSMVNVNGGVDRGDDDRTYPADRLPANNYDPAPMTSAAPDASMSQPANDVAAATAPAATTTDYNALPATSAGTTSTGTTAGTTATATAPASDSNLVVSSAPETRIDLSPPSDPLYNLPPEGSERAPRPDRN